ncbi:MAG: WecB/TagA/CpsF family glycosyltransferase [Burkholderiaceae bacterium]
MHSDSSIAANYDRHRQAENHQLGCRLSLIAGNGLANQVANWAQAGEPGYICVANTHQVTLAQRDPGLNEALHDALAVTTDSQVLAKALNHLGTPYPEPVLYGPDLMQAVIEAADAAQLSIGLFGSTPETCDAVARRIRKDHPTLKLTFAISPPMMSLSALANCDEIAEMNRAPADVLLVSLGCPKQEQWMHLTNQSVSGVKIGLGGAFEFYAGLRARSPAWVHKAGLEWLYRLCSEPRRLMHRYLVNNPLFVLLWLRALIRGGRRA